MHLLDKEIRMLGSENVKYLRSDCIVIYRGVATFNGPLDNFFLNKQNTNKCMLKAPIRFYRLQRIYLHLLSIWRAIFKSKPFLLILIYTHIHRNI